ncbi:MULTISPECIES: hypothetical protein [Caballeronia]|uniref:hypothetical protein n=1 Tax=Caballeronia TaxID=1827195 RepID=UPI001FD09C4B|nr:MULTISPECIES: hypothetical protein [Caballeronia]MDR5799013.1 hypothetical protein [Caballeronia sp. LZ001]
MNYSEEHERLLRSMGRHPDQIDAGAALWANAKKLIRKPLSKWPQFEPVWDCNEANFYFALDGESPEAFASDYPQGVRCCDVDLSELDARLCAGSRRSAGEVWGFADSKVAEAICFWAEGGKMTPPMILLVTVGGEAQLHVKGGNNRLAIVRAKGIARVKVLILRDELTAVKGMLPSLIECTTQMVQDAGAKT